MERICYITGCGRRVESSGLCYVHYKRWRQGGPLGGPIRAWGTGGGNREYRPAVQDGHVVDEHVLVVEKALGHKLPPRVCIHHVNFDKRDNRNTNLVVCPSQEYHQELHKRIREQGLEGYFRDLRSRQHSDVVWR